MDLHSVNDRVTGLKRQEQALAAQLTSLRRQRESLSPGDLDYTVLSGEIDRVGTDLVDTQADLRHARQQRRTLTMDPGFYAVYRREFMTSGDYASG